VAAYIAFTEGHALMLNEAGVCIRIERLRGTVSLRKTERLPDDDGAALRCIGAQYVASIDPSAPGGMGRLPRAGTSMLFAANDPDGCIYCVRVGPLTRFESLAATDESGVHRTASGTLKLSALGPSSKPDVTATASTSLSVPPPYPAGYPGPEAAVPARLKATYSRGGVREAERGSPPRPWCKAGIAS
jgi:hypothetical protein